MKTQMRKIRYTILVSLLGLLVWALSGGISFSRDRIKPQALWSAVSNTASQSVDSDKDGLSDEEEKKIGTNPQKADTDGDGFLDGQELKDGYDPLRPAPGDKLGNSNSNDNTRTILSANSNSNVNSNVNTNGNSGGILIASSANQERVQSGDQGQTQAQTVSSKNYTDEVAKKVDEIIANYGLISSPLDSLPEETKTSVQKEIDDFVGKILQETGLDLNYNIPESSIIVDEKQNKEVKNYLEGVKAVFKKHGLLKDNQALEDGFREMINALSAMRQKDIDWERARIWREAIRSSYQDISVNPVNPELKNVAVRVLRVLKGMDIVLSNIKEGDYFISFLSAGRAEKINKEIDLFTEEIKKTRS